MQVLESRCSIGCDGILGKPGGLSHVRPRHPLLVACRASECGEDRQTDTHTHTHRQTDRQTDRQAGRQADRDRRTDRQAGRNRQAGGQTARWTDLQTDGRADSLIGR